MQSNVFCEANLNYQRMFSERFSDPALNCEVSQIAVMRKINVIPIKQKWFMNCRAMIQTVIYNAIVSNNILQHHSYLKHIYFDFFVKLLLSFRKKISTKNLICRQKY